MYGGQLPDGKVAIKPLRGEQEELLAGTSGGGAQSVQAMRHVVASLVDLHGLALEELLVSDFTALTFNVMGFSYDPNISVNVGCRSCGHLNHYHTTLDQLPCTYLTPEKISNPETFRVLLPTCKARVGFRLMRLRDSDAVESFTRQHQAEAEALGTNPTVSFALANAIETVDDNPIEAFGGIVPLRHWVRSLTALDLSALRTAMNNADCGYELSPTIQCAKCKHSFIIKLPEVATFFRRKSANA
jgi:hypothetical protein